jgi:hypothetical protein
MKLSLHKNNSKFLFKYKIFFNMFIIRNIFNILIILIYSKNGEGNGK